MTKDTLKRFRDGLKEKRFSVADVSRISGMPYTTLADMKKPDYGSRFIENLSDLEAALNKLLAEDSSEAA
ncbi:MAG: hypothetical protein AAGK02_16660 [Pseudomonadota bacterium]